jgi:hypothetical protein
MSVQPELALLVVKSRFLPIRARLPVHYGLSGAGNVNSQSRKEQRRTGAPFWRLRLALLDCKKEILTPGQGSICEWFLAASCGIKDVISNQPEDLIDLNSRLLHTL